MSHLRISRTRPRPAGLFALAALTVLAALGLAWPPATAQEETPAPEASPADGETWPPDDERPRVLVMRVDSAIHPVAAEYVEASLQKAAEIDAAVAVIELNTPGGLLDSTREITQAILASDVPVVVYVSPSGARAASAGFFILMSADVAAMTPGTNTGAAHPVSGQGEDIEGDMGAKVEQDAAANIRSLARRHGRNADAAQTAVMESKSFTAEEALELELVEYVAPSLTALLEQIDGLEIEKGGEDKYALKTADAAIVERPMPTYQRFLSTISHPAIASILMALGMLGLYVEVTNPGTIFPGVVGAICMILGFYALSILPINYAGIALILLAVVLFFAETQVPSFGLLTTGGAVALVLGSVMLFKDFDPVFSIDTRALVLLAVGVAVPMAFLSAKSLQMRRRKAVTGREGLIGDRGVARNPIDPRGKVFVHGELWHAVSDVPIAAGAEVEVTAVDGMILHVRPSPAGPAPPTP